MQYFSSLPKIATVDGDRIGRLYTNLMARVSIMPALLKNPLVYYEYDIQEGDTPEIIAHKYYGNSYRYWIVLFANQILDPLWDWPMNNRVFYEYVSNKYPNNNIYSDIHHYEKVITKTDIQTGTVTIDTVNVSQEDYNLLFDTIQLLDLPTGSVKVEITKNAVSIFEYETILNDKKRTIRLLNSTYASQLENEFQTLMAA